MLIRLTRSLTEAGNVWINPLSIAKVFMKSAGCTEVHLHHQDLETVRESPERIDELIRESFEANRRL